MACANAIAGVGKKNRASDKLIERQAPSRLAGKTLAPIQSTYDPIKIKALIGGRAWEHPSIFKVYGLTTAHQALHPTPHQQSLYDESSAFTHLTQDDPPLYMVYSEADGPLPPDAKPGQGIHHPNFGRHLKAKLDELQVENTFVYPPGRHVNAEMLDFFRRQFAK